MTAKDELAALVADLDDDTAAEVLAYALWLLEESQPPLPASAWQPFAASAALAEQRMSRAEAEDIGTRTVEDGSTGD